MKKIRLDVRAAKAYVNTSAAQSGKTVVYHPADELQTPYTTGDSIHTFEPNAMWDDDQWDMWHYMLEHEIGHEAEENMHPYWKDLMKETGISAQSFFGCLVNLMSDHIQEHNRIGKLRGRDQILKRGRSLFTEHKLLSPEVLDKPRVSREEKAFKVAAIADAISRQNWNEQMVGSEHAVDSFSDAEELEMYNSVIAANIKMHEGENEYDSYRLAIELLEAMGFDPDEEQEKAKTSGDSGGEGEGEQGEGGDEESSSAKGKGKSGDDFADKVKDMVYHTHYEKPEAGQDTYNKSGQGIHIEYTPTAYSSKSWVSKDPLIVDMKKENWGEVGLTAGDAYVEYTENEINKVHTNEMMADKIKLLLTSMKQVRWNHGHKRGRISSKNLWKATKSGGYSQEVFKKRADKLEINTAVTVLTDFSGSMGGEKYAHAAKAALLLNESMAKIGVPIELLGFSELVAGPLNVIMKSFHEISVDKDVLTKRYATAAEWMTQNSDGESIDWAFSRLIKRPEKRRILIVLSDGSPAAYNDSGDEWAYTKQVIKTIEEDTPIEIYGVGIMDDNVSRLYSDHKVINNSSDLEGLLLGLVKNKVLGIQ